MSGFLYIATNSSMPGLVKIGRTATSPTQRMSELHTTGVPTPFELEFVAKVPDAVQAEKRVHAALNLHRISKGREFFRVSVTNAARRVLEFIGPHEIDWKYTRQRQAIETLEGEYKKELVRKWDMQQRVVFNLKEEERKLFGKLNKLRRCDISIELKLYQLGHKPDRPVECWYNISWLAYFPLPIG